MSTRHAGGFVCIPHFLVNGISNVKHKGAVYALYIVVTTMPLEETRYSALLRFSFLPPTNYTHGVVQ